MISIDILIKLANVWLKLKNSNVPYYKCINGDAFKPSLEVGPLNTPSLLPMNTMFWMDDEILNVVLYDSSNYKFNSTLKILTRVKRWRYHRYHHYKINISIDKLEFFLATIILRLTQL